MWYAIQVRTRREEAICTLCKKLISKDILKECFLPRWERMRRYQGNWHKEKELLFPGYVFLITEEEQATRLYESLKKIPDLTKMFRDQDWIIPIHEKEADFLQKFGGEEKVIQLSHGYIEGDQVFILDGPMKNFQGEIKRIDRHKRVAAIEIEFFGGRKTTIKVGLEIIRKNEGTDGTAL